MQSVLHLNLSHASQPIGGVNASPLSSPEILPSKHNTTHTVHKPTDFHDAITPVKQNYKNKYYLLPELILIVFHCTILYELKIAAK